MSSTRLIALATALPAHRFEQSGFADWVRRGVPDLPSGRAALLERFCTGSRIAHRHSVLAESSGAEPSIDGLFAANGSRPLPGTKARMEVYRREALPLAAAAARKALTRCPSISADAVTHLIVATCTGFHSPGVDISLVNELGLRPDVRRQLIGFMGCHAAFNALRAADDICGAHPQAVVLMVCVELCTIHFRADDSNDLLAAGLFADGAAAALLTAGPRGGAGLCTLIDGTSLLLEGTAGSMTWSVGDHGFRMTLEPDIPAEIAARVPQVVDDLLRRAEVPREAVGFWVVHPGGARIVSELADRLGLSETDLASTWGVLRDCGNMSSPTVLFILERCLQQRLRPGAYGAALAFGPGLTIEAALLRAP